MKTHFIIIMYILSGLVLAQEKHVLISDTADQKSITKQTFEIKQLEVNAQLVDQNIRSGSDGIKIDLKEIKNLPRLGGESDPLKTIQYLGGVSVSGEANSGLYVRGGNNDQNLILLNHSVIQNPNHVLGIFSVFNPDIVESMRFIKTAIPAEYGGRISAVVDVNSVKSIADSLSVNGNLGLISSKLALQIPLTKSFSIWSSVRASYLGKTVLPLMSSVGVDSTLTSNNFEFYDLNLGFNLLTKESHRISGHLYTGKDNIRISQFKQIALDENLSGWGNTVAGLEYLLYLKDNASLTQNLSYSGFQIHSDFNWYNVNYQLNSSFSQWNYKADLFCVKNIHNLKLGVEMGLFHANPHFVNADSSSLLSINSNRNTINSSVQTIYLRDEWESGPLQFNIGLRLNNYLHFGPYSFFEGLNKVYVDDNQRLKTYQDLEPRLFVRYILNPNSAIKASASRLVQYLNQVPITNFGIPADLQLPAGLFVLPQRSWHYSGGYFTNSKDNKWELSSELYYKTLENQLEFNSSIASLFSGNNLEQNLIQGRGWAYGLDAKLKYANQKIISWISYNLAWSYRQFDNINYGEAFFAHNDRRNNLSLVGVYKLSNNFELSAVFVYADGSRLNLPLSWYMIENKIVFEYGKYNAFKMPAYHRLDVSVNYKLQSKSKLKSEFNFSIYNVYNRANPYNVSFTSKDKNGNFDLKIRMSYLLPIIPSVSWSFKW